MLNWSRLQGRDFILGIEWKNRLLEAVGTVERLLEAVGTEGIRVEGGIRYEFTGSLYVD
jgi:hypothetical protein